MRGINCDGLRKSELIDALCSYDNNNYRDDDDDDGRLDVDVESQGSYNEGSDLESDGDGNVYLHRDDGFDLGILAISLVLHRWLAVLDADLKGKWSWSGRLKESMSKL